MSAKVHKGRFSSQRLLTPEDHHSLVEHCGEGSGLAQSLRLLSCRAGWRYLGRVVLSGVGWVLAGPLWWLAAHIQRAWFPLSPFTWLRHLLRFVYKLVRRGRPLSEAQEARWREAAEALHPEARRLVLALKGFQARLPHGWGGQYTAFGDIALRAGQDQPDLDLLRHEWAHYWWFHHMTREERAAFMQAVEALAQAPDVPDSTQPAQEIARAYLEGRDAHCRTGKQKVVIPLQSNDGYRVAYCFGFFDLEPHAYIAQLIRGDVSRLPPGLRPFYTGFFPV